MNEEKSTRYHRLRRRISVASVVLSATLAVTVLLTGVSLQLRVIAQGMAAPLGRTDPGSIGVVACYTFLFVLINELGSLPLALYGGFFLERRYGLLTQTPGSWLADQVKALVVSLVLGIGAACVVYLCIQWSAHRWWLPAGVVFALVIVGLTNLAPVLLLPLFYRIRPLDREALRVRLMTLAQRAGARVLGAYELGLGDKTRKANAALTGLGATRRIMVSDTMLSSYSDDEIEVVLAHELAHHVHGDIWKGIAFEGLLMLGGAFAAARLLDAAAVRLGLAGVNDVAGLPVLLLAAGAVSLVMMPAAHALSRANERSADRFALELTKNPAAFVSAMRRLGAQNLAEEDPSPIVQYLFYSHPPVRERIAAAQAFRA